VRNWISDINLHLCSQENQQKLLPPELHFLTPVCTISFVGWGFAPDLIGGAFSAPQTPYLGLRGSTSKGTGSGRERMGEN